MSMPVRTLGLYLSSMLVFYCLMIGLYLHSYTTILAEVQAGIQPTSFEMFLLGFAQMKEWALILSVFCGPLLLRLLVFFHK